MDISKNFILLATIISLVICFVASLLTGHPDYAAVAIGAMAGWVGGNWNGRRQSEEDY